MTISTDTLIERNGVEKLAHVTGRITKHYGRLCVEDIDSDMMLTEDETIWVEDQLLDQARYDAICIPESERTDSVAT